MGHAAALTGVTFLVVCGDRERLFVALFALTHGYLGGVPVSAVFDYEEQLCEFLLALPSPRVNQRGRFGRLPRLVLASMTRMRVSEDGNHSRAPRTPPHFVDQFPFSMMRWTPL